jgi:hypothetical protein
MKRRFRAEPGNVSGALAETPGRFFVLRGAVYLGTRAGAVVALSAALACQLMPER